MLLQFKVYQGKLFVNNLIGQNNFVPFRKLSIVLLLRHSDVVAS